VELDETTSSEAPPEREARQGERCWGTRTRIAAGLSEGESGRSAYIYRSEDDVKQRKEKEKSMDERKRRWILIKGKEGIRGRRTTAEAQGGMDERVMTLKDGGVIAKGARVTRM
jgi:hypothetical protein